jgi:Zn-dependent protease
VTDIATRITELLFLLPVLLVSMMFHELSHGYVAYRLGDPTAKSHGRLTVNPISHLDPLGSLMFVLTFLTGFFVFGWAKPVPVDPRYFRNHKQGMMVVSVAGPAANFVMAVLMALLLRLLASPQEILLAVNDQGPLWIRVVWLAYQVNVVLGIFNLIPIPPLDGSRIVGGFLPDNLYYQWAQLDRFGPFFILAIFFIFREPFFTVLQKGFVAVSRVLLPGLFS